MGYFSLQKSRWEFPGENTRKDQVNFQDKISVAYKY